MLTCYKVFPLLERLQTEWETLRDDNKYFPIQHTLNAGLKNMAKWYRKMDDTSIYFISHGNLLSFSWVEICFNQNPAVLDPTRKLSYVKIAWDPEFVEAGMRHMKKIVCHFIFI